MKNNLLKSIYPHLLAHGIFILILFVYYSPVLSGKRLIQNDLVQSVGALQEAIETGKNTGEEILWSNSSFGGMPVWRGHSTNILRHVHTFATETIPTPVLLSYLCFLGFYILIAAAGGNVWLAFAGGAAFAFTSFNIVSIEAGHINKVFDMALMAPVIAGILLAFKKRYWIGAFTTTLSLGFLIFYAHYQIIYYLLLTVVVMGLYYLIKNIKEKTLPHFIKASLILIASALLAVGPNISNLWTTQVYAQSTTRGGSELSTKKELSGGGLDKDYAFDWSYGKMETFTLFIPYFHGGGSNEELGTGSASYKALIQNGVPKADARKYVKNIPLYWGDQPFTAGPVYFGAIIVFLFVFGMFFIKSSYKWWILGVSLVTIMLAWGKNFAPLNDFLFYYFPLYNKFRSVTMILSVTQLVVPFLAFLALIELIQKEISYDRFMHSLKWSAGICIGVALAVVLLGGLFTDFSGARDSEYGLPDWFLNAILEDRASKLRMDAFRSLFFVTLAAGILWAYATQRLKPVVFFAALAVLVLVDLTLVDNRYLNDSNFQKFRSWEQDVFVKTAADEFILRDTTYYRVYNMTKSPFNDATTSYYHKSIGGYSAIKLGRYQEMIDSLIRKNNMAAFNMLNTKYIIVSDQKTGEVFPQRNPEALGNAWFVDSIEIVANADEEIAAMQNFDPKNLAIVDQRFAEPIKGWTPAYDSTATIQLIEYHPNRLKYSSQTSTEQFVVFSEIYYQPGWNAYIDGQLAPHGRVNYILRGMKVPAGTHTIEFKFEPEHYYKSEKVSFWGSILFVLFLASMIGINIYQRINPTKA
jgi:hypothetical protein